MQKPAAVIFDIGNVLITWNPERVFDALLGDVTTRERLFAEVDLHGMNDAVDRGANFRQAVTELAEKHPGWQAEIEMWHDHWLDMASPAIPESWEILHKLKAQGVPVHALSNFGIQTFELAETVYDILGAFDRRYISGHMGVIKPDPQIYQMVEQDSGLAGADIFFTDDRADNIAAAAARGWQTHQFTAPAALAGALRDLGFEV